jgi:hypothetical protein
MFDTAEIERLFPSIQEAEPKETYLSKLDKMPPVAPEETIGAIAKWQKSLGIQKSLGTLILTMHYFFFDQLIHQRWGQA